MLKVGIVDDHDLIRLGAAAAIGQASDIEVIWTAGSVGVAWDCCQQQAPDVVVIDLKLGEEDGLVLIRKIGNLEKKVKAVVSSMRCEQQYAPRCFKAGASGFVSKSEPVETLIAAIRNVHNGGVQFSPQATALLLEPSRDHPDRAGVNELSDRELQVLEYLGDGKTTKEIASYLHLSPKTIETFRERVKRKLKLESNAQLIHFATSWVLKHREEIEF